MINRTKIRNMTHASFYARGLDLYMSDKVKNLGISGSSFVDQVSARVMGSGSKMYEVSFLCDVASDSISGSRCDCPAFRSYDGLCKHLVAAMLKYTDRKASEAGVMDEVAFLGRQIESLRDAQMRSQVVERSRPRQDTTPAMKQLLERRLARRMAPLMEEKVFGKVRLEPTLTLVNGKASVEFSIGTSHMYVVKDVFEFDKLMQNGTEHRYGKQLSFVHLPEAFAPESREMVRFLRGWIKDNAGQYASPSYYGYRQLPKLRTLPLSEGELERVMDIMKDREIEVLTEQEGVRKYLQMEAAPPRSLELTGNEYGIWVKVDEPQYYMGNQYCYCVVGNFIYRQRRDEIRALEEFQACAAQTFGHSIYIRNEDVPLFCRELLPALEKHYVCTRKNFSEQDYNVQPVTFEIYLDAPQDDMISCRVIAVYGELRYNVYGDKEDMGQRDLTSEIPVGKVVASYCNAYDEAAMAMVIAGEEDKLYEFLTEGIPRLQELGDVFVSDALKRMKVNASPKIRVGISLSGDLLELTMTAEDVSQEQLLEILNKYDRKKKYYRLKNGEFVNIAGDSLETLLDLKQGLGLTDRQLAKGQVSLPKYRAMFLDSGLDAGESFQMEKDRAFRALVRNMKTVEDNDFEVPKQLAPVLREYQKKGFLWLKTLYHNGFGGILADDMGLGKTLQVIAFLVSEYQDVEKKRCLIVTPASLVYNWYSEIQRFAPQLPAVMVLGNAQERAELIRGVSERQILITSYDLLKRDMEHYEGISFFYQVIDEAQFIKNHNTQAARAVKEITAGARLALTGTPVENRLSELWSIFDYLMPGFLFAYQRFREEFESPIVQQQDEKSMERLQKMIRPFVLRRLKKDVLKDLPDKLEEEMYACMEGEQQKLYDAHVKRLAMMLDKQTDEEFRTGKIQILAELTKLRQLCCEPALLYEGYTGGSAKGDMCMDLIRNAVNGGHKVLLFSQFTSMLEILCNQLETEKITFYTLTGATSKEKRKELVESFQKDDTSVFCISLKAGGTGLNLTAADIVIHYDPWWNLAVQNQATDRAHRIGQKNAVTVYKLVTKGTIEENILKLQEKKSKLAEQLLGGEGVGSGSFTREELKEIIGVR